MIVLCFGDFENLFDVFDGVVFGNVCVYYGLGVVVFVEYFVLRVDVDDCCIVWM